MLVSHVSQHFSQMRMKEYKGLLIRYPLLVILKYIESIKTYFFFFVFQILELVMEQQKSKRILKIVCVLCVGFLCLCVCVLLIILINDYSMSCYDNRNASNLP